MREKSIRIHPHPQGETVCGQGVEEEGHDAQGAVPFPQSHRSVEPNIGERDAFLMFWYGVYLEDL